MAKGLHGAEGNSAASSIFGLLALLVSIFPLAGCQTITDAGNAIEDRLTRFGNSFIGKDTDQATNQGTDTDQSDEGTVDVATTTPSYDQISNASPCLRDVYRQRLAQFNQPAAANATTADSLSVPSCGAR
jgi:hypothetical protein